VEFGGREEIVRVVRTWHRGRAFSLSVGEDHTATSKPSRRGGGRGGERKQGDLWKNATGGTRSTQHRARGMVYGYTKHCEV